MLSYRVFYNSKPMQVHVKKIKINILIKSCYFFLYIFMQQLSRCLDMYLRSSRFIHIQYLHRYKVCLSLLSCLISKALFFREYKWIQLYSQDQSDVNSCFLGVHFFLVCYLTFCARDIVYSF